MLALAYADHYEASGKNPEAQAVYEQALKRLDGAASSDLTLVYIQCVTLPRQQQDLPVRRKLTHRAVSEHRYMRSMRRTGGAKAMREVFKMARNDKRCTHQVFVAAALMELSSAKQGEKVRVGVLPSPCARLGVNHTG